MKLTTLIVTFATLILLGCTSVHYVPYVGEQPDWPVRPGALAETIKELPVYYGPPSKPYTVMGKMDLAQNHKLAPSALSKAVQEAKARGADALIVLEQGQQLLGISSSGGGSADTTTTGTVSSYGNYGQWQSQSNTRYSANSFSAPVYGSTATVLLIQFK